MINYMLFSDIWDSALKAESRDGYTALRAPYIVVDEDTFTLDAVYDMALGGVRRIRAIAGLPQTSFSEQYGIPRRSLEDWETGKHLPTSYVVKMLGYCVLTDTLMLRNEFKPVHDRYALTSE